MVTAIETAAAIVTEQGLPDQVTIDREMRFVGESNQRESPSAFLRFWLCLGVEVNICPPRRPDLNAFVERYHRSYQEECLQVYRPCDLEMVRTVTAAFKQQYNHERPHQGLACGNQPPRSAFPVLPARPAVPATVDPDRSLEVLSGQRYVRKVRANGTVMVDSVSYYVDRAWEGKYVTLRIDAAAREFVVEYREQPIKRLPIKGLVGSPLPLEAYLKHITLEARTQLLAGRAVGQQLRLPF